jgi:hypothetical protein
MCYCHIYVCVCVFVNVESKKNVTSLPRGAFGKGAFAECFWQLRSVTLGKISQLGCSQLCRA